MSVLWGDDAAAMGVPTLAELARLCEADRLRPDLPERLIGEPGGGGCAPLSERGRLLILAQRRYADATAARDRQAVHWWVIGILYGVLLAGFVWLGSVGRGQVQATDRAGRYWVEQIRR